MVIKKSLAIYVAALLYILSATPSNAGLQQQRQDFLEAEKALQENRLEEFQSLSAELISYPLYPYLVFEELRKNISLARESDILAFLRDYSSTPLASQLRSNWLDYLARNQQWSRLARDFQAGSSRERTQCSYGRALLETGQRDAAFEHAEKMWLHGSSRPDECDPLFNAWRDAGMLTPELVRERIALSIDQGQLRLARYLGRYLPVEDGPWLDLWLDIARDPSLTPDKDWSQAAGTPREKVLVYGMKKLVRKDTPDAADDWEDILEKNQLHGKDFPEVEQDIALYLTLRRHDQALQRFQDLPDELKTPRLREWHVRTALYEQKFSEVLDAWDNLLDSQKASPRWQYWKARALEEQGFVQQASGIYLGMLGRQNYFSLLAADRLERSYILNHSPLNPHPEKIDELKRDPGIQRSLELYYLDREIQARREWMHALQGKNRESMAAAAVLARSIGWHDRAIQAAAVAGQFEDLDLRFPLSYHDLIAEYAGSRDMDPAWIMALARQESMFMPDVRSPAGAIGLMQIMPATGRSIAARLQESMNNPYRLTDPATSVRYGVFYLNLRLQELQQNPVLATAAYNAGVHRVKRWLPKSNKMPADIWVENIPFNETRDYVERVNTYTTIYQIRLGMEPTRVYQRMPDILPGHLTAEQVAGAKQP
ncbi:transglycosylase SLT domain-containing protein [Desulfonatronospira sp.]|uniref:transglycosylase SLT domain-containing protein n=1 Tax=Desulfonatronospira sp. TaxID=1962951 RepID=UPI0025C050D1|nr:transglycosylase SLT domain-containing protein [Desulfonatronospira sp.]